MNRPELSTSLLYILVNKYFLVLIKYFPLTNQHSKSCCTAYAALRRIKLFKVNCHNPSPELGGRIEVIQMRLRQLKSILEIADARQEVDEGIRNWVAETREFAYDIEDRLLVALSSRKEGSGPRKYGLFKEVTGLHQLQPKIQFIEEKILALESDLRVRRINPRQRGSVNQVLSITGMAGIGKTTMAKKLYQHADVRNHFDVFAWACVSQQWQQEDVLQRILNKLEPDKG